LGVALELDAEGVDLEESRLPQGLLEVGQTIQVVGIVPTDGADLQVGPIRDLTLRQPQPVLFFSN